MLPFKTSNEAAACYAPGKKTDHKDVNQVVLEGLEYTIDRSLEHSMSPFAALSGRHKASFASGRGDDSRAGRRMTNRFDAMTVGIQHEGTVIVGVILRSKSGRAVVAPS